MSPTPFHGFVSVKRFVFHVPQMYVRPVLKEQNSRSKLKIAFPYLSATTETLGRSNCFEIACACYSCQVNVISLVCSLLYLTIT